MLGQRAHMSSKLEPAIRPRDTAQGYLIVTGVIRPLHGCPISKKYVMNLNYFPPSAHYEGLIGVNRQMAKKSTVKNGIFLMSTVK